ncbi:hypothetical protein MTBUT4_130003 [Magnetospirillum sp. UT-4]|nr:hypothetical protein MTBUT4_130003 [Magnetospirillum sp. UT-4]
MGVSGDAPFGPHPEERPAGAHLEGRGPSHSPWPAPSFERPASQAPQDEATDEGASREPPP